MQKPVLNSDPSIESEITFKEQLVAIWKASKVKPQALIDHPEDPPHFAYIWEWFFEFPPPITWTEIKAWSEFSGIKPARWEGEILIHIDRLRK